ncbi:MAG: endo-1,4-beta-xylanase [Planctomycetota bacterium]
MARCPRTNTMLSFAVFDEDGPASAWPLRDAFMFGPDGIPVPAQVRAEGGRIVCEKPSAEAAGLSMPFPAIPDEEGDAGSTSAAEEAGSQPLVLSTCLLPERDEPYLLSLELARQRIMVLLNKLEDWQLFDLSPDEPALQALEDARLAFTEALVSQSEGVAASGGHHAYSVEADRRARRALDLATHASALLTDVHVKRALPDRLTGSGYAAATGQDVPSNGTIQGPPVKSPNDTGLVLAGKPAVAASINANQFSPATQQVLAASSDFLALPMSWRELEPDEGRYSFASTDRWIEWAVRRAKMTVLAGPVIGFDKSDVPDWLYIWEHDYETLREVIYEHVKNVITRYRRTVPRWTVLSGLNRNLNIQLTFEQMMDLTRMVMLLARKLHPQGKMQIEVVHPFGTEPTHRPRSLPGTLYAEMVQQAGIGVDAWAVRLELERPKPGHAGRDLMQLAATLDRYALLDRPLAVHAVAPAQPPDQVGLSTEDIDWLSKALEIIASRPSVVSMTWQERELPPGAKRSVIGSIVDGSGGPRPAVAALAQLRRAIREGRPTAARRTAGPSEAQGVQL